MTLSIFTTYYHMFCLVVTAEKIAHIQREKLSMNIYDVNIMGLYLKALENGNPPSEEDFAKTFQYCQRSSLT